MARKPISSNRAKSISTFFDPKSLVQGIFNEDYILVVGNESILDKAKFPDSLGDVNRYIIEELNKDRRNQIKDYVDESTFEGILRHTPPSDNDPINTLLTEEFDYEISDMSPELVDLLKTRLFKFVMTTTVDAYLETLLRDIWGNSLLIVNIEDSASIRDFQQELSRFSRQSQQSWYMRPFLFYVFGKAIKGQGRRKNFVETDIDAIKCIEKWMKLGEGKDRIIPFLRQKQFISLGCKYDDWYFRFFWYILTRRFGRDGIEGDMNGYDSLAIRLGDAYPDSQLRRYLSSVDAYIHSDLWAFMRELTTMLTSVAETNPLYQLVIEKRREGGVFISYCSADVLSANELFCRLEKEQRFNVWYDIEKLSGGSDYMYTIPKAICKSKVFLALLSPSIEKDLLEKGELLDTFYSDEWRWAAQTPDIVIIPVAVDGYNLRGKAHSVFESIIGEKHPVGIDLFRTPHQDIINQGGSFGYAKLIDAINNNLGI